MHDAISRTEQLVQRFVDQDLSAEERIQFVAALARDAALRERALELERLVLDAATLPRPAVPTRFVAEVMERTARESAARVRFWDRAIDLLWAPRALRWNLASAFAVCVVVIAATLAMARPWSSNSPPVAAVSIPASVPQQVLVRLVVVQPGARVVHAAGDFNGWNPTRTPLEQTANGAWAVTLPLEPGRYEYQFVIDGEQWVGDPFAPEQNDDGFGSRNAVLDVRPPTESL